MYAPSAHDCYAFCSDMASYHPHIRTKVTQMSWDTLISALTKGVNGLSLDEGSHKLILVEPQPDNIALPLIRIVNESSESVIMGTRFDQTREKSPLTLHDATSRAQR